MLGLQVSQVLRRLLVALAITQTACGTSQTTVMSPAPNVVFPRQRQVAGPRSFPSAAFGGRLVNDNGCLRVGNSLVVWPAEFTLITKNGVLTIIDEHDRTVAQVGDELLLGGGEIPPDERAWLNTEILRQRPPERCPGPYWLATDKVQRNIRSP